MPLVRKPNIQQAISTIRQSGREGVLVSLNAVKRRHQGIVSPWKESRDKPEFTTGTEYRSRLLIGWVKVEGEAAVKAHKTVWQLLEHGTRIRFMGVSDDWISKTQPGQLSSGAGSGNVTGLDVRNAQPGILARNWGPGVAKEKKESTDKHIKQGWANGFRKAVG